MADEWVLVPKTPSEEMIVTATDYCKEHQIWLGDGRFMLMYQAMLAAAPPPPVREEMEGDMREAVAKVIDPSAFRPDSDTDGVYRKADIAAVRAVRRKTAFAKADLIIAQIVKRLQPAPWKPEREAVAKIVDPLPFAADWVGMPITQMGRQDVALTKADAILALPSALVVERGVNSSAPPPIEVPDAASDELREYVDRVLIKYRSAVNGDPGLLSVLYDVDLLPEQLLHVLEHNPYAAGPNASRMALICELWMRSPPIHDEGRK